MANYGSFQEVSRKCPNPAPVDFWFVAGVAGEAAALTCSQFRTVFVAIASECHTCTPRDMLAERIGTASQDAARGAFFVGDHAGRAGKPGGQGHGQREGPWRYLALRVGARASMAEMPSDGNPVPVPARSTEVEFRSRLFF